MYTYIYIYIYICRERDIIHGSNYFGSNDHHHHSISGEQGWVKRLAPPNVSLQLPRPGIISQVLWPSATSTPPSASALPPAASLPSSPGPDLRVLQLPRCDHDHVSTLTIPLSEGSHYHLLLHRLQDGHRTFPHLWRRTDSSEPCIQGKGHSCLRRVLREDAPRPSPSRTSKFFSRWR